VNLESSVNNTLSKEKEAKKKMNASNARALTAMKQKIKKAIKEYESDVKKYQEVLCAYFHSCISSKTCLGSGSL
jgi:translation initiation factor 3 subunit C